MGFDKGLFERRSAVTWRNDGGIEIRFLQHLAVDTNDAVGHFDGLARQRDNALDEVSLGQPLRFFEYHDVTPAWIVQVVGEFVDQDPIVVVQRESID